VLEYASPPQLLLTVPPLVAGGPPGRGSLVLALFSRLTFATSQSSPVVVDVRLTPASSLVLRRPDTGVEVAVP